MAKENTLKTYFTLEKLRTFPQKIHKLSNVKSMFLPQNLSIPNEKLKVEFF